MWIEINLRLPQLGGDDVMTWELLLNCKELVLVERKHETMITVITTGMGYNIMGTTAAINATWAAIQLALMGQETKLDIWGHIRPLVHEQREALYKYMLYQETIGRMAKEVG